MDDHINKRILAVAPTLTEQLARLARFILSDGVALNFLNARQLASTAGVSPSTVIRFARKLGYDGFRDLRAGLFDRARLPTGSIERVSQTVKVIGRNDLLRRSFERDKELLEQTLLLIDEKAFFYAVNGICKARTLYLIGEKSSHAVVQFLYYRLSRLGINCKVLRSAGAAVFSELIPLQRGDVMCAVGFRLIPPEVLSAVQRAKEKRVLTIVLTSPPASPLSLAADISIFANRGSESMLQSITPCFSVCQAFVLAAAMKLGPRIKNLLAEADALEPKVQASERRKKRKKRADKLAETNGRKLD